MASVKPFKDKWRVQVEKLGVRESKVFATKLEAQNWAAMREAEILSSSAKKLAVNASKRPLSQVISDYVDHVSPMKRGERWERIRANQMLKSLYPMFSNAISDVSSDEISEWVRFRLKSVAAGSVRRELSFLSSIFEHARVTLKLIPVNPCCDAVKPREPDHRDRIISLSEIRKMLSALGYVPNRRPSCIKEVVANAFLLALRTGMRAGEICGLSWAHVYRNHCHLPQTKTKKRDVPLSRRALRIIDRMRGWDNVSVFNLKPQTLDAMFRKYRAKAGLIGFTFHDSRHTAATHIAASMSSRGVSAQQAVLDLCKMFGWSNLSQALVYYNPTASDIAKRLDQS